MLHENRNYNNPYPIEKKVDIKTSIRPQVSHNYHLSEGGLKFDSNFECGNLDAVIQIGPK